MPSFLKDITPFYGTGEKNADGQSLEEFLEHYDPCRYRTPSCTTDAVIFSMGRPLTKELNGLKILLVKRSNHPSIGYWALPGGFANLNENLDDTAKRELQEETGVTNLVMEQIATYGDYDRDPRTRVITTAYMALVQENKVNVQAGDDAADAVWCDVQLELVTKETLATEETQVVKETSDTEETGMKPNPSKPNAANVEIQKYRLHIKNKEKGLDTTALVIRKVHSGLIREEKFTVEEPGMIAVDHAAIIVQAMTILKSRLD